MTIPIYQIDTFSSAHFTGDPATVCLIDEPLDEATMQAMAQEHHPFETAFIWPQGEHYAIRWFSAKGEVAMCSHATLAAAHVLFNETKQVKKSVTFQSKNGLLHCQQTTAGIEIRLPLILVEDSDVMAPELVKGLGFVPKGIYSAGKDHLIELENVSQLIRLRPNLSSWQRLDLRGVIVSAPGLDCDFVFRCFYPNYCVTEEVVLGSAHCVLAPFWSKKISKEKLCARQLSLRGGELYCQVTKTHVILTGQAVTYMAGTIHLQTST